jgi:hypothetical protein
LLHACRAGVDLFLQTPREATCELCNLLSSNHTLQDACLGGCRSLVQSTTTPASTTTTTATLLPLQDYLLLQCSVYSYDKLREKSCNASSSLFLTTESRCTEACQLRFFSNLDVDACSFGCGAIARYRLLMLEQTTSTTTTTTTTTSLDRKGLHAFVSASTHLMNFILHR